MRYIGNLDKNFSSIINSIDLETFALRSAEALEYSDPLTNSKNKDVYVKKYNKTTKSFDIYKKNDLPSEKGDYDRVNNFDIDDDFVNFVIENFIEFKGSFKKVSLGNLENPEVLIEALVNGKILIFKQCD